MEKRAVAVLLDVPVGSEIGIDLKIWYSDENFRGFKKIPPGLHYIYYSAVDNMGDAAPRVGFFHFFKDSEFLVRKWDKQAEEINLENIDEREIVGLKNNYEILNNFLAPYPSETLNRWSALTTFITESILNRLNPKSGRITSAVQLLSCSDADRPRGKKKTATNSNTSSAHSSNSSSDPSGSSDLNSISSSDNFSKNPKKSRLSTPSDLENQFLPDLKPIPGTELRLTPFPEKTYPEGSTPSEITKHSLDLSYTLDVMLSNYNQSTEIIGELQFSYICFLIGHSLEAFEQWKKMVGLLCSCDAAIKKHRNVYDMFVTTLEPQLREIPEEFLADIVANNNYIYTKLKNFFRTVCDGDIESRLKTKIERFKRSLTSMHKWEFNLEVEDEEDAPVVVET